MDLPGIELYDQHADHRVTLMLLPSKPTLNASVHFLKCILSIAWKTLFALTNPSARVRTLGNTVGAGVRMEWSRLVLGRGQS